MKDNSGKTNSENLHASAEFSNEKSPSPTSLTSSEETPNNSKSSRQGKPLESGDSEENAKAKSYIAADTMGIILKNTCENVEKATGKICSKDRTCVPTNPPINLEKVKSKDAVNANSTGFSLNVSKTIERSLSREKELLGKVSQVVLKDSGKINTENPFTLGISNNVFTGKIRDENFSKVISATDSRGAVGSSTSIGQTTKGEDDALNISILDDQEICMLNDVSEILMTSSIDGESKIELSRGGCDSKENVDGISREGNCNEENVDGISRAAEGISPGGFGSKESLEEISRRVRSNEMAEEICGKDVRKVFGKVVGSNENLEKIYWDNEKEVFCKVFGSNGDTEEILEENTSGVSPEEFDSNKNVEEISFSNKNIEEIVHQEDASNLVQKESCNNDNQKISQKAKELSRENLINENAREISLVDEFHTDGEIGLEYVSEIPDGGFDECEKLVGIEAEIEVDDGDFDTCFITALALETKSENIIFDSEIPDEAFDAFEETANSDLLLEISNEAFDRYENNELAAEATIQSSTGKGGSKDMLHIGNIKKEKNEVQASGNIYEGAEYLSDVSDSLRNTDLKLSSSRDLDIICHHRISSTVTKRSFQRVEQLETKGFGENNLLKEREKIAEVSTAGIDFNVMTKSSKKRKKCISGSTNNQTYSSTTADNHGKGNNFKSISILGNYPAYTSPGTTSGYKRSSIRSEIIGISEDKGDDKEENKMIDLADIKRELEERVNILEGITESFGFGNDDIDIFEENVNTRPSALDIEHLKLKYNIRALKVVITDIYGSKIKLSKLPVKRNSKRNVLLRKRRKKVISSSESYDDDDNDDDDGDDDDGDDDDDDDDANYVGRITSDEDYVVGKSQRMASRRKHNKKKEGNCSKDNDTEVSHKITRTRKGRSSKQRKRDGNRDLDCRENVKNNSDEGDDSDVPLKVISSKQFKNTTDSSDDDDRKHNKKKEGNCSKDNDTEVSNKITRTRKVRSSKQRKRDGNCDLDHRENIKNNSDESDDSDVPLKVIQSKQFKNTSDSSVTISDRSDRKKVDQDNDDEKEKHSDQHALSRLSKLPKLSKKSGGNKQENKGTRKPVQYNIDTIDLNSDDSDVPLKVIQSKQFKNTSDSSVTISDCSDRKKVDQDNYAEKEKHSDDALSKLSKLPKLSKKSGVNKQENKGTRKPMQFVDTVDLNSSKDDSDDDDGDDDSSKSVKLKLVNNLLMEACMSSISINNNPPKLINLDETFEQKVARMLTERNTRLGISSSTILPSDPISTKRTVKSKKPHSKSPTVMPSLSKVIPKPLDKTGVTTAQSTKAYMLSKHPVKPPSFTIVSAKQSPIPSTNKTSCKPIPSNNQVPTSLTLLSVTAASSKNTSENRILINKSPTKDSQNGFSNIAVSPRSKNNIKDINDIKNRVTMKINENNRLSATNSNNSITIQDKVTVDFQITCPDDTVMDSSSAPTHPARRLKFSAAPNPSNKTLDGSSRTQHPPYRIQHPAQRVQCPAGIARSPADKVHSPADKVRSPPGKVSNLTEKIQDLANKIHKTTYKVEKTVDEIQKSTDKVQKLGCTPQSSADSTEKNLSQPVTSQFMHPSKRMSLLSQKSPVEETSKVHVDTTIPSHPSLRLSNVLRKPSDTLLCVPTDSDINEKDPLGDNQDEVVEVETSSKPPRPLSKQAKAGVQFIPSEPRALSKPVKSIIERFPPSSNSRNLLKQTTSSEEIPYSSKPRPLSKQIQFSEEIPSSGNSRPNLKQMKPPEEMPSLSKPRPLSKQMQFLEEIPSSSKPRPLSKQAKHSGVVHSPSMPRLLSSQRPQRKSAGRLLLSPRSGSSYKRWDSNALLSCMIESQADIIGISDTESECSSISDVVMTQVFHISSDDGDSGDETVDGDDTHVSHLDTSDTTNNDTFDSVVNDDVSICTRNDDNVSASAETESDNDVTISTMACTSSTTNEFPDEINPQDNFECFIIPSDDEDDATSLAEMRRRRKTTSKNRIVRYISKPIEIEAIVDEGDARQPITSPIKTTVKPTLTLSRLHSTKHGENLPRTISPKYASPKLPSPRISSPKLTSLALQKLPSTIAKMQRSSNTKRLIRSVSRRQLSKLTNHFKLIDLNIKLVKLEAEPIKNVIRCCKTPGKWNNKETLLKAGLDKYDLTRLGLKSSRTRGSSRYTFRKFLKKRETYDIDAIELEDRKRKALRRKGRIAERQQLEVDSIRRALLRINSRFLNQNRLWSYLNK